MNYADKQPWREQSATKPGPGPGAGSAVGIGAVPEVPREMTRLNESIDYADKSLNELLLRLDGKVLRPSEPEPAGGATISAGREMPSTGYGQELNGFVYRVDSIASRVQDLLRRLEV